MHYRTSIIQSLGMLNRLKSASALPGCPETEDRQVQSFYPCDHGSWQETDASKPILASRIFFFSLPVHLGFIQPSLYGKKNIKKIPRHFISQVFGPKFPTRWRLFLSLAFELKIKQNRSSTNDKCFFSSIQTQYYLFPAAPVTQ